MALFVILVALVPGCTQPDNVTREIDERRTVGNWTVAVEDVLWRSKAYTESPNPWYWHVEIQMIIRNDSASQPLETELVTGPGISKENYTVEADPAPWGAHGWGLPDGEVVKARFVAVSEDAYGEGLRAERVESLEVASGDATRTFDLSRNHTARRSPDLETRVDEAAANDTYRSPEGVRYELRSTETIAPVAPNATHHSDDPRIRIKLATTNTADHEQQISAPTLRLAGTNGTWQTIRGDDPRWSPDDQVRAEAGQSLDLLVWNRLADLEPPVERIYFVAEELDAGQLAWTSGPNQGDGQPLN